MDFFEESQEPFNACVWKARREKRDRNASEQDDAGNFSELDLTALVLARNLRTRAAVIAYAQNHGTVAMQAFINKSQRQLDKHVEDTFEWGRCP